MLSLKQCLQDVANFVKSTKSALTAKQNKAWKYITETTGTISYDANQYNELLVIVGFGGVYIPILIPVVTLYSSAGKTHFAGTYGGRLIYVLISRTSIVMDSQPGGYTATIYLYAR